MRSWSLDPRMERFIIGMWPVVNFYRLSKNTRKCVASRRFTHNTQDWLQPAVTTVILFCKFLNKTQSSFPLVLSLTLFLPNMYRTHLLNGLDSSFIQCFLFYFYFFRWTTRKLQNQLALKDEKWLQKNHLDVLPVVNIKKGW